MHGGEETWVLSKSKCSVFTYNFGNYTNKIACYFFNQNLNYRLDLAIFLFLQESGFNIKLFNFNFVFASIKTQEDPRTVNTLDFIPEVESEVIKDSALHMLERSLVYTSNKVFRDSKQSKI